MTTSAHQSSFPFLNRLLRTRLALGLIFAVAVAVPRLANTQTFSVVYNFQGEQTGFYPTSGVSIDRDGSLSGTTQLGGPGTSCYLGCGIAFKLVRNGSGWLFTPIHGFMGGVDGGNPNARLITGPDGTLFGTTTQGGGLGCMGTGCGTVFNLHPPQHVSGRVFPTGRKRCSTASREAMMEVRRKTPISSLIRLEIFMAPPTLGAAANVLIIAAQFIS